MLRTQNNELAESTSSPMELKLRSERDFWHAETKKKFTLQIEYLTQIKLYQSAIRVVLHDLKRQQTVDKAVVSEFKLILKQLDLLFEQVFSHLSKRRLPPPIVLPDHRELNIKISDLTSELTSFRELVIEQIASKLIDETTNVREIHLFNRTNEIKIVSDRIGLNAFGFFQKLKQELKTNLNNNQVDYEIKLAVEASDYPYLCLTLSTQLRIFSTMEINTIFQTLLPFCYGTTSVFTENIGRWHNVHVFARAYESSCQVVDRSEANNNDDDDNSAQLAALRLT